METRWRDGEHEMSPVARVGDGLFSISKNCRLYLGEIKKVGQRKPDHERPRSPRWLSAFPASNAGLV